MTRPPIAALAPRTPARAAIWLVAVVTLLHLLVAGRVGLGTDEAHYALYALHPDWSYFDHPPLVGWLQALVLPFSQSDLALRIMPMALFAASSAVLYRLTRAAFPDDTPWLGFAAVAVLQSGFAFNAMGVLMLPEDPLLLFGLLSMLTLLRAVQRPGIARWAAFGLCMGLAGLSKYTAVVLVPSAILYIAWKHQWRLLRAPGPWLAILTAAVVVSPVFVWNAQHQWISFAYQWHHGTNAPHWHPLRVLISQTVQLFAYGPLLYVGGYLAVGSGLRRPGDDGTRLLLSLSLPMLLFFAWNSGHVETLPHWTALGWAGLAPLAARLLLRHGRSARWRVATGASIAYSVALILIVHSLLFIPWLRLPEYRNPLAEVIGWDAAAQRALALRKQMAKTPGPVPVLFTGYWTEAARLAWYARPTPLVVVDRRFDQFDLWFGPPEDGQRGIYIVSHNSRYDPRTSGADSFARCKHVDSLDIVVHHRILNTFYYYRCKGYRHEAPLG